jgi:hypothetical protein
VDSCGKHPHEHGVAICRRCGGSWCGNCIVYSFGPKKPPYCLSCAMVAGGVRSTTALPPMPKRQLKRQMKALKAERKAAAKAEAEGPPPDGPPDGGEAAVSDPADELTSAMSTTDWSSPWWEDRQPTLAD